MSSAGQIVGGIVGAVIGWFVGGPAGAVKGAYIGLTVGGLVDPPKGPVIRGPRLDDLSVQTATYGAFIPRVYGTTAIHGNVFWVQGDSLIEREVVTESGKGGSSQTTENFEYFVTFAVGLCEGPIAGVRRIWIGDQLWYDAGASDFAGVVASNEKSSLFTLYTGTDTQLADPLIQADKGAANVPAYRGLVYIVFDTLPLGNYSNSLMGAQVKVELFTDGSQTGSLLRSFSVENDSSWYTNFKSAGNQYDSNGFSNYIANSPDHGYPIWVSYINGVKNSQQLSDATDPILSGGTAMFPYGSPGSGVSNSLDTLQYVFTREPSYFVWGTEGFLDAFDCQPFVAFYGFAERGGVIFCVWQAATSTTYLAKIGTGIGAGRLRTDSSRLNIYPDNPALAVWGDSAVTAERTSNIGLLTIKIYTETSGLLALARSFTIDLGVTADDQYLVNGPDNGSYVYDDKLYIVARVSTSLATARVIVIDLLTESLVAKHQVPQSFPLLSTAYIPSVRVFDGIVHYGQRNNSSLYGYVGNAWGLNIVSTNSITLGTIVSAECLKSKLLAATDIDVTELTDAVRGYRVGALGAIRAGLDPLRAAWPFDVVQAGYDIKFKKRGSASVATITAGELDAHAAGDSPGVSVTDVREMDLILPYKVGVKYLDSTREYDLNEQYAERLNTDAVNESAIDLPIVLTASEAAGKAETLLYLYWLERYDVMLTLPPSYAHLEPGDVITVEATFATYELRLTSAHHLPDGRVDCRAKYNSASIYTPAAQGAEGESVGATLTIAGPTVYVLLDIPLLRDDDDTAGFPVAMTGYLSGWPGGVLFRSEDGGETWLDLAGFISPGTVMGYATNILATHGGTVYDFASTLTVRLYQGTLSSVTEAQLFAAQNWFAYGKDGRWEIIAAKTATLQGDGSYILQDFLRGQLGTEWATGLHVANDSFVRLSAADLEFVSVNASTIGGERNYRGITAGKTLDSDSNRAFTYTGVNLECLSPVHATGRRHPTTNDWTLTWIRRTRFAGWRDYVDATLGETVESYEVDIFSSSAYTTVLRTLTSATQTVAYTSANQVTDFGSNQATLYLKIYQLSATVGRGYPLTISITR